MPEVLDAPAPAISVPKPAPAPPSPKPPSPPPAQITEPSKPSVSPPASKGSKMDSMFGELEKISKPDGPGVPQQPESKTPEPPKEAEEAPPEESVEELKPDATPGEKLIAAEKADRKAKAWPLVKEWRNRYLEQEKQLISSASELAELKKSKSAESPEMTARLETLNKELEDTKKQLATTNEELKYTAYERSQDFQTEYVKPYEEAWTRAIHELKGLQVTLADGSNREITWQDIGALANMEPDVRRKTIKEQFPDDVQEVNGHVKAIRDLADRQKGALEKYRKEGDTRSQQRAEAEAASHKARATEILQTWQSANDEALKHEKYGKYFSPSENDKEWNERLQRGFEKADSAFSVNPLDPKLTAEQRSEAVKRQAAQRNRAAAFSGLVYLLEKERTRASELEAKLREFENTEPGQGEGKPAVEQKTGTAWDRLNADLNALAK